MNENERDIKFQESAKILWEKMMALHNGIDVGPDGLDEAFTGMETEYKALIAHFLRDFIAERPTPHQP